ncbi:hypothetical protein MY910_06760 [Haemophilus influenzae]|nr:hypothetical protein [Pasteurella multocida]MCK8935843.1 hypothetical protein [Haemophilus influenzae]MCK9018020.1 hypothetical protein [Haemophilus influenzae]MCK9070991.1 hypothetical protein [Haemophilus influenzae]MCK9076984.1 hypothetical protein [Haemophilus influenzae]
MCKENRILELGKIFVSRRILAELTTEKINEVISWHQNGCIIMLGNKDWIEKPPHPLAEIVMNFYQADNGKDTIQLSTSVDDDGNRTTKISFSDESEDEQRGHFDLMNPLMILVKIIKLRWIHILSYDQMVSRKINNQTTRCANSIFYTTLFTNSAPNYT